MYVYNYLHILYHHKRCTVSLLTNCSTYVHNILLDVEDGNSDLSVHLTDQKLLGNNHAVYLQCKVSGGKRKEKEKKSDTLAKTTPFCMTGHLSPIRARNICSCMNFFLSFFSRYRRFTYGIVYQGISFPSRNLTCFELSPSQ